MLKCCIVVKKLSFHALGKRLFHGNQNVFREPTEIEPLSNQETAKKPMLVLRRIRVSVSKMHHYWRIWSLANGPSEPSLALVIFNFMFKHDRTYRDLLLTKIPETKMKPEALQGRSWAPFGSSNA